MIDKQIIKLFKDFQRMTNKYLDFDVEDVAFELKDFFNEPDINLIGSRKLENHDVLKKMNDTDGIPVYDASPNILTYIKKEKYKDLFFNNSNPENPDLSFANEGNSSAGTNFIFHKGAYFVNNHRTVILFGQSDYYSLFVYYCIKDIKKTYDFKRGNIPSQSKLIELKIKIPIPKPLDEKYTSYKIQEILVEFIEYYKNKNDKGIEIVKEILFKIDKLDKLILPKFFAKDDTMCRLFNSYAKSKKINIKLEDVEFDEKRIKSDNKNELVCNKRMGFTPKRDPSGNINWFTVRDLNANNDLFINKPNTKEKTTIELIEQKVDKSKTGKSKKVDSIKKNDVLVSFKLTVGTVKIYNSDLPAYCNEAIDIITPFDNIISKYLAYNCMFEYPKHGEKTNNGVTLNDETKNKIIIRIPKKSQKLSSIEIQECMAGFLDEYFNRIKEMQELCSFIIEKYTEHTQVLISNTLKG